MPRKKDPEKPVSRRSHGGCSRCRLRRIRCDQARPRCGYCASGGHTDCVFGRPLKWQSDYVGRAFGRAGVWSKKGSQPSEKSSLVSPALIDEVVGRPVVRTYPYGFLNLTVDDLKDDMLSFENDTRLSSFDLSTKAKEALPWRSIPELGMPSRALSLTRLDTRADEDLFLYYISCVCPLTVPHTQYESPFSRLLLPLAVGSTSQAITESMLGVAASHRAKTDTSFHLLASVHASRAMGLLRQSIGSRTLEDVVMDPEVAVVMVLLCQLEVLKDDGSHWEVHLRGARDLIKLRRRQGALNRGSGMSEIITFTERFFAFCDVMGRTACGEEPKIGNEFWATQDDTIDVWMGCSPRTINVISEITELSLKYRTNARDSADVEELEGERTRLANALQTIETQGSSCVIDDIMEKCMNLKQISAELYLHVALSDAKPSDPPVRESVRQILRLLFELLEAGIMAGLTWPLFIAACQLDPNEDLEWPADDGSTFANVPRHGQLFVLYALDRLSNSLSNIARTRAVIQKVWTRRESAADRSQSSPGGEILNDWAYFVAPFCHHMSLV